MVGGTLWLGYTNLLGWSREPGSTLRIDQLPAANVQLVVPHPLAQQLGQDTFCLSLKYFRIQRISNMEIYVHYLLSCLDKFFNVSHDALLHLRDASPPQHQRL
jgi:hypothetical protein